MQECCDHGDWRTNGKMATDKHANTVKPVYNGHSMEKQKVAVEGRWPLYKGSQFSKSFHLFSFIQNASVWKAFQKDCYHNISQLFGIVDLKLLIITEWHSNQKKYLSTLQDKFNIDWYVYPCHAWRTVINRETYMKGGIESGRWPRQAGTVIQRFII